MLETPYLISIYFNYNVKDLLIEFFNPRSRAVELFCGDTTKIFKLTCSMLYVSLWSLIVTLARCDYSHNCGCGDIGTTGLEITSHNVQSLCFSTDN